VVPTSGEMLSLWKQLWKTRSWRDRLRPEIKNSWERSVSYGVDPYLKKNPKILPFEEMNRKRQELQEFLSVALPTVQNLFEFVKGTGFVVALADGEGTLLVVLGDEEGLEFIARANFIEGTRWSEDVMGTNAVGLSLVEGKPVQVYGYEHYCICAYNAACSAAPIRDAQGNIIGVLDLTGPFHKVHYHTLGMVVAGAHAIQTQLALKRALKETLAASQRKAAIMEAVSEGLLVTDEFGYITDINRAAASLLRVDANSAIGQNLAKLLGEVEANYHFINLVRARQPAVDVPSTITTGSRKLSCTVTISPLVDPQGSDQGRVVVLRDYKRTCRLVRQMISAPAQITFDDLVGKDPRFLQAISQARAAAASNSTVLLLGESGTGKDLFAQAIHNASPRRHQPFVAINCGAIPRELITSELFGYEEGAFTGAKRGGNPGKFELADQGTLFLDEIAEMPLELQTNLLRVLEDRRVMRVGGKEYIPVNVRIIAATNKDLAAEVEKGNFRRDLYYRLNVMVITLPPLRERSQDIEVLAQYFLRRIAEKLGKKVEAFSPHTMTIFQNYPWPGNVRELQNVIERAVNLATGELITPDLLPDSLRESLPNEDRDFPDTSTIRGAEEYVIRKCLQNCKNKSQAARELRISRTTLYRKMREYGIPLGQRRPSRN